MKISDRILAAGKTEDINVPNAFGPIEILQINVGLTRQGFKVGVIGNAREADNANADRPLVLNRRARFQASAIFLRYIKVAHVGQDTEYRNAGSIFGLLEIVWKLLGVFNLRKDAGKDQC